ncbi:MAG: HipA domain-containing protein [Bdellovibrionales bacterium]|nr:HipA domain-containing protein [Bdellovibrionales bacterium]
MPKIVALLKVAEAKILRFKTQKSLTVTRFDRKWIKFNEQIERLHQEDLCQALGYSVSRKYESDGGPGIVEIMEFLRESDAPNEDREIFFRAQIIFFMLGATDGHAKNFSIFNTSSGFRLTPLYDVLSVHPAWSKGKKPNDAGIIDIIYCMRYDVDIGNKREETADFPLRRFTQLSMI